MVESLLELFWKTQTGRLLSERFTNHPHNHTTTSPHLTFNTKHSGTSKRTGYPALKFVESESSDVFYCLCHTVSLSRYLATWLETTDRSTKSPRTACAQPVVLAACVSPASRCTVPSRNPSDGAVSLVVCLLGTRWLRMVRIMMMMRVTTTTTTTTKAPVRDHGAEVHQHA